MAMSLTKPQHIRLPLQEMKVRLFLRQFKIRKVIFIYKYYVFFIKKNLLKTKMFVL